MLARQLGDLPTGRGMFLRSRTLRIVSVGFLSTLCFQLQIILTRRNLYTKQDCGYAMPPMGPDFYTATPEHAIGG